MPRRCHAHPVLRHARSAWLALAMCALASHVLVACGGCEEKPSGPVRVATPPPAEAPGAVDEAEAEPVVVVKKAPAAPGFSFFSLVDEVPLCVFSDAQTWFDAKLLHDARPQKLAAGRSVVLGAFSPWCVHEKCDQRPSMQCQVTREGNTLIVHSRFWGEHKDGARCTKDCKSVTASCETPALEAGTYAVQHGQESFTFEVPSLLRQPCFGSEHDPPAVPPAPPTPTSAPTVAPSPEDLPQPKAAPSPAPAKPAPLP